ncbi:MAG TPA: DNA repair protein RecO [Myxococcales bacterium]|nr:DNA repair protein RecO [Myxococcales bacterium]
MEITTAAVVLRRFDHGESDQVLWLLTADRGRVSAFAPGARRSKRRFAGTALEPFSIVQARLASPRRGELWRLAELASEGTLAALRGSLEAIACAGAACELCAELSREADPSPELYELLAAFLRSLDARLRFDDLFGFVLQALGVAGLAPQLTACVRCGGGPLPPELLDPSEGGRLCARCPPRGPGAMRARGEALQALAAVQGGASVALPPDARALLWRYLEHQLGKRLASRALLEELHLG